MDTIKRFSVDRIVGEIAVLEDAEGNCVDVPVTKLPSGITEGVLLCFSNEVFQIDEQGSQARRQRVLDLQNQLKSRNSK